VRSQKSHLPHDAIITAHNPLPKEIMDEAKKNVISLLKAKKFGWKDGSEANIQQIRHISDYFSLLKRSHGLSKSTTSCLGSTCMLILLVTMVDVIGNTASPLGFFLNALSAVILVCLCGVACKRDDDEIEFILVNFETGSLRTWMGKKKRMGHIKLLWKILATNNRGFTNEEVLTRVISSTSQCIALLEQNLWNTEQLVKKLQEQ